MLRNYWQTASTALAKINDNISTALEGLDKEMVVGVDHSPDSDENSYHGEVMNSEEDIKEELDAYRKLLEDAQMQHVQLSKQLGNIIAAKDAEIAILKVKHHVGISSSDMNEDESTIIADDNTIKLIQEKISLEKLLEDYEIRYQDVLRSSNEGKVLFSRYERLTIKHNHLESEYHDIKHQYDVLNKDKTDEIDNLVSEYSKLAADCELRSNMDMKKIHDISTDNEVLKTKIESLEHMITEFADRAANVSSNDASLSPSHHNTTSSSSAMEMKELRSKLVNTQYDLKQRDDTINYLKQQLDELSSSSSSPSSSSSSSSSSLSSSSNDMMMISSLEKKISELISEKSHMTADIDRLIVEKREAEDAGKNFYEQSKSYRKDIESLKQQLHDAMTSLSSQPSSSSMTPSSSSSSSSLEYDAKIISLQDEISSLQAQYHQLSDDHKTLTSQHTSTTSSYDDIIISLKHDHMMKEKEISSSYDDQMNVIRSSYDDAMMNIKYLQHEYDTCKSLYDGIKHRYDDVNPRYDDMKHQYDDIKHQYDDLKHRYDDMIQLQDDHQSSSSIMISQQQSSYEQQIKTLQTRYDADMMLIQQQLQASESSLQHTSSQLIIQQDMMISEKKRYDDMMMKIQDDMMLEKESYMKMHDAKIHDMMKEYDDMKHDMMHDMTMKMKIQHDEMTSLHMIEKASYIQSYEHQAATALSQALADMEVKHHHHIQQQHDTLSSQHIIDKENIISSMNISSSQALLQQKHDMEHDHSIKLDELRVKLQDEINIISASYQQAKDDLINVEKRYEVKMKDALTSLMMKKDEECVMAVNSVRQSMQKIIDEVIIEKDEYLAMYTKENKYRKMIHNKLLELQGNIRVICRVRPVLDVERRSGEDVDVTSYPTPEDIIITRDVSGSKQRYEYDRVFAPGASQVLVFEAVQPMIVSVLDGYNICIFAYGQTGSGKTYTMEGAEDDDGISPRAISELFKLVNDMADDYTYTLTFSMLEIYNETILDLLDSNPNKDKLDVRQTPDGNIVSGLTEVMISSPAQVKELMSQGQANRAVGSHDMNEHSSRSHSILTVVCRGKNKVDGSITYGKINLIDLAGSERISKTDATGDRLKEAQNINRSLSALGDVISALGNKKNTHIPFRNSKLTFLLQDSLGGNSKVLMFVNISPAIYNVSESLCSLNFASRCRNVELGQASKKVIAGDMNSSDNNSSSTSSSSSSTGTPSKISPATSSSSLSSMKSSSSATGISSSSTSTSGSSRRISSGAAVPSTFGRK